MTSPPDHEPAGRPEESLPGPGGEGPGPGQHSALSGVRQPRGERAASAPDLGPIGSESYGGLEGDQRHRPGQAPADERSVVHQLILLHILLLLLYKHCTQNRDEIFYL